MSGHAVLVHDLRRAVGAAGDPEGLPRLLFPNQPAPGDGPPLYHGGHPAVGQLGVLTAHHREEGAGADGEAEALQVGDGLDDDGAGAGHRHLHLSLPLGHQVGRSQHQDALEARHVRGGGGESGRPPASYPALAEHFSVGPPPNRTCGFHRIRLSSVVTVGSVEAVLAFQKSADVCMGAPLHGRPRR